MMMRTAQSQFCMASVSESSVDDASVELPQGDIAVSFVSKKLVLDILLGGIAIDSMTGDD